MKYECSSTKITQQFITAKTDLFLALTISEFTSVQLTILMTKSKIFLQLGVNLVGVTTKLKSLRSVNRYVSQITRRCPYCFRKTIVHMMTKRCWKVFHAKGFIKPVENLSYPPI